jgi:preprotein translocase subunit SecD
MVYYRTSGVIAVFALIVNLFMILAAMAAFEGTLTLPGLAGLTLSLAMSVDANVLIFESTRDEVRKGKPFKTAMQEGFQQAFGAIFDANVTMLIASLVLLSFGYGPIRGFAVTMLIGNVLSLYTNVFMTRVVFDWLVFSKNRTIAV